MMKMPTSNSLGPSRSRPAADIPKRETAIYEDDRTVLTVLQVTAFSRFSANSSWFLPPPRCQRTSAEN